MLKANFNRAFLITLLSTLIFIAGCSQPEEKKSDQLKQARELSAAGQFEKARELLLELTVSHPNDVEVLSAIGRVYSAEGDHTMAAFFLDQAHLLSSEDTELLFLTTQSQLAANQPAGHLLEKLVEQSPEAMDADLWIRLAQSHETADRFEAALNAYLESIKLRAPSAETAAAIGQLYLKTENLAQSEAWFERAADSDGPSAFSALFGLLQIKLLQKDWAGAEGHFSQLETRFPGAVEASEWAYAREEIIRWRANQETMRAELARAEERRKAAEAARRAAQDPIDIDANVDHAETSTAEQTTETDSTTDFESASTSETGKAQVITDIEAAERMADTPAIDEPLEEAPRFTGIQFDPGIAIEPADPDTSFQVDFDESALAAPTTYAIDPRTAPLDTELAPDAAPVSPSDGGVLSDTLEPFEFEDFGRSSPPETSRSVEELLAEAETAELERDFKTAIRKYWAAITVSNTRADVWHLLSRAYLIDGQINNAEIAALEAVRLAPREVAYTLDYLRVAQRSKTADAFLADLETAYDRFPSSPEITLSLARAQERISQNNTVARNLYRRFIDLAPNHPLIPEARAAFDRLR